jgi:predicted dehydrogenase
MTIRVALFGSGWIQSFHARAVFERPDAELVAVANHREDSARTLAETFGIPRVTTDWEALAADPEVDAAVVSTPNALHASQAIALLRNGKHVLVEKPRATSVAECDAMIEASSATGARLMVAHCWRFRAEVQEMRSLIASSELGAVVSTRGYGVHANWGPSGWFIDPALAGGGALVDMGVHAIDTARYLLGDPEPERVCATVRRRYGTYEVDDDAHLLIDWSNGVTSEVVSGWWWPHLPGLEADTEVFATKGYSRIWSPDLATEDYEHCTQPLYSAQMDEFLDAIAEGRQPRPSGEDGRIVMRIVEEAYASSGGVRRS